MDTLELKIDKGYQLFRYCTSQPPELWSKDYKDPHYSSKRFPNWGNKNAIGAFFFFNNKNMAVNTARKVIIDNIKYNGGKGDYWITSTNLLKPILLLDLSSIGTCLELICALNDIGIDILTDDYVSKGIDKKYSLLKEYIENPVQNEDIGINAKVQEILGVDNLCIGGGCQLLTDFSNGIHFKNVLTEKGYDGYIFNECPNLPNIHTICLFESEKLNIPVTERFLFDLTSVPTNNIYLPVE